MSNNKPFQMPQQSFPTDVTAPGPVQLRNPQSEIQKPYKGIPTRPQPDQEQEQEQERFPSK